MLLNKNLSERQLQIGEFLIIAGFTLFPLFFSLPFRDNLYLSWEGTYRFYLGQVPYKDFGMPLGYGYFIVPVIFFKIFGPFLSSLLYAQVLINLISLLAFRSILGILKVDKGIRLISVLIFCLSYSFIFFWPWYNNTAFVYELLGINFVLLSIYNTKWRSYTYLLLSALFAFLAFFTKQDYGGLAILFIGALLLYHSIIEKNIARISLFIVFAGLIAAIFILPLLQYNFAYWFNYGQAPHQSRISIGGILSEILGGSSWEKFYLLAIVVILLSQAQNFKTFIQDRNRVYFALLSIGMILQTLITKVTSRLPTDTTTYFHAFAAAFILTQLKPYISFERFRYLSIACLMVLFWWSGMLWKYASRILKLAPASEKLASTKPIQWKNSDYKTFKNISLPESTIEGIGKIKLLTKNADKNLKVLNMSELTPLAYELNYVPQKGLPLWYHLNVGMFQKQVDTISKEIQNKKYDLVLFEVVPSLDNFYPESIRKELIKNYTLKESFLAPRKEGDSHIEVYIKTKTNADGPAFIGSNSLL